MKRKILILGLGNILLKDEGMGIHAVNHLSSHPLPEEVEVIEGGTLLSPDVLEKMNHSRKVIIIDALSLGKEPGSVYRLEVEDPLYLIPSSFPLSLHQLNFLLLLPLLKRKIPLVIWGMEPAEIDWGMELSSPVKENLSRLLEKVIEEVTHDCIPEKTLGRDSLLPH